MAILLDTNILLRLAQKHHPQFWRAQYATEVLNSKNETLVITHQSIVEFWSVATRPVNVNGLGITTEKVASELERMKRLCQVLPELPIHEEWQRLVIRYRVLGKSVHDARLVAAMIVHGVTKILTFNGADFTRYSEISVLDPFQIS